jgi:hypothetical protein
LQCLFGRLQDELRGEFFPNREFSYVEKNPDRQSR